MVFLLAIVGMVCWGVAPIFVKLGLKDINPLVGLFIRTIITGILISGVLMANGGFSQFKNVSLSCLGILLVEAILATLVGDLAYFAAIKRGSVSLVTIIMSSSPLITVICAVTFLGEAITVGKVVGAGFIILGIVLVV